jgi:type I restriction enzyme S subunit
MDGDFAPIIWKGGLALLNQRVGRVICGPEMNKGYARYELVSHLKEIEIRTGATTVKHLSHDDVASIVLTLPPLKEQEAIAEALSDADAAIESLDALIAKKRDIRDAMLFDLVVSSEHKNSVSFKSDVSLKARIGWQGLTTGEYEVSSDCYLVTGTDLNGGAVNWESCWQVAQKRYDQDPNIQLRNNDVLVTKDGTIGKVGFVADLSGKATLNSGVFVIRPTTKNLIPEYLRYVMCSPLFRRFLDRLAAGSTISHLYQKDFVNFAFAVPAVDEQVVVSKMLDDVDSEIRTLIEQSAKLRMVKEGMMQDLLTGKVRLV